MNYCGLKAGTLKCARWGCCRVETPAALGPPGLHTTTRELQTCTFEGPGAANTTKIPRKDPLERKKERKLWRAREKKSAKFWASQPSGLHPWGAPPFGAPPRDPSSAGRPQNFALFSLSRSHFRSFSLSLWGVFSWNFGGVLGSRAVWNPGGFCKMSRTILQLICPPPPSDFRKKSDQLLQILVVSRKKASNTTEIPREDTPRHLRDPHLLALVCAVCAAPDSAACCCFSCCWCSCCGLLLPLFLLLLVLVAAFGPPTVEPPSPPTFAVFDLPKC